MTTDKSMFAYFKEGTAHLPRTNRTVSFYGRELTLGEVMAEIDGFAARLTEIGVGKGDNVIICLGNIPDAVIAFYAVNKIGAIASVLCGQQDRRDCESRPSARHREQVGADCPDDAQQGGGAL